MIAFINSSKTMNFTDEVLNVRTTIPHFKKQADQIVEQVLDAGYEVMQSKMRLSNQLADKTFDAFVDYSADPNEAQTRPAMFAYRGDVYQGLDQADWTHQQANYGQQHLRILSGLYAILRPLDAIQRYRMEMKLDYQIDQAKNLEDFWKPLVKQSLLDDFADDDNKILLNLASNEYATIIQPIRDQVTWVDVKFLDYSNGEYKFITYYGKRARGLMAKYICQNEVDTLDGVKQFDLEGYRFYKSESSKSELVFKRKDS